MQFYYTVSSKEMRPSMPPVPVLLSAASFVRERKDGSIYLRSPQLPNSIVTKGADCGGFVAATCWKGCYRFSPLQYVRWIDSWQPQWAAAMDMPCLSETLGDPGASVVEERQQYSTKMAELFWSEYRCAAWTWCPTITGWSPSQYEHHARQLAPLIRAMFLYYYDPGWGEPEDEEHESTFRVGIGGLCGRAKPAFVLDIVQRVSAIIGSDIPLHCWSVKLKTIQAGVQFPGVVSSDSGVWNSLWGREHERRRASGLTVVQYSWQVAQPNYERKIAVAQAKPQQRCLDFTENAPIGRANTWRHHIADSLAEGDGMAEELLQQLMDDSLLCPLNILRRRFNDQPTTREQNPSSNDEPWSGASDFPRPAHDRTQRRAKTMGLSAFW